MPKFIVEVYELHSQKYEVYGENEEDAIDNVLAGEGRCLDNEMEFIETADRYNGHKDGVDLPDGIRSVEFESQDDEEWPT